jgi:S-formylglutathione hydrolase FrmB
MALRQVDDALGAPWERPLAGTVDKLVVESELLADNPLGDPSRRPLWVYRPPGVELDHPRPLPTLYVIQGYFGRLDALTSREPFEPNLLERVDALFAGGDCPDAIVVYVDAWTAYGGSQFVNSIATGPYQDYLCDEVVPFVDERYPVAADRDHRGLTGKSSGGFGAMIVPMLRPEVFGALASHAGDALYEACYLPTFPDIARKLRDDFDGSYDVFFRSMAEADHFDMTKWGDLMLTYGCAAAFTPDPDHLGKALLPFELDTGRIIDERWARWLALDPVRMVPQHAEALRSMRRIYLDAGRGDEWYLDLGATAVASELEAIGAAHTLELFDGKHGGIAYRYPRALRELAVALSA